MKSMALESQDLLWNVSLSSCLQDDHRMGVTLCLSFLFSTMGGNHSTLWGS